MNSADGFVINGITGLDTGQTDSADKAGYAVSEAGDVNNDTIDDIIIGAPFANGGGVYDAGQAYVIFGRDTAFPPAQLNLTDLNGADGFTINGINESGQAGHSVSAAGDVNSDTIDDIIIGRARFRPLGRSQRRSLRGFWPRYRLPPTP